MTVNRLSPLSRLVILLMALHPWRVAQRVSDAVLGLAANSLFTFFCPSRQGDSVADDMLEFLKIETANWFNAVASRFWYNFR